MPSSELLNAKASVSHHLRDYKCFAGGFPVHVHCEVVEAFTPDLAHFLGFLFVQIRIWIFSLLALQKGLMVRC